MSQFIIRSEMLMQEVWRCGLDWNDTLPEELSVKMKSMCSWNTSENVYGSVFYLYQSRI